MALVSVISFKPTWPVMVKALYVILLLISSLSYELTFQIAYFTLPVASLCFPLLFLLAAILADRLSIKQCVTFLLACSIVNYGVISLLGYIAQSQINEFWVDNALSENEIYGLLLIGFHISLALSVTLVMLWRSFGFKSNYMIIATSAILANFVDLIFMWPTLYSYMDDGYLASWKLLTLATFKINFLILCLPVGWLVARHRKL